MTTHSIVIRKLLSMNGHLGYRVAAHHFKVCICSSRNGIAILDSDKTLIYLRNACNFIGSLIHQKVVDGIILGSTPTAPMWRKILHNKFFHIPMNILRPLSPHLPIYKPELTSTFPISHRISEAFLDTIVLLCYLLYFKMGVICFTYENFFNFFFYSSKLILISVEITALALSYHLYNGVRHLLKDFSGFFLLFFD